MRTIIEHRKEVFSASFLDLCRQQFERNKGFEEFMLESAEVSTTHFVNHFERAYELRFRGPFTGQDYEYLTLSIRTESEIRHIPKNGVSLKTLALREAGAVAFVWNEERA